MAIVAILCSICGLAGVVWTMIIAIQNDDTVWGIVGLFCGIVAIIYCVQNFEQCKLPLALIIIGIIGNVLFRVLAADAGI